MTTHIDENDARILDLIQRGFPLDPIPFDILGQRLSIAPDEVISRIARMKSDGIIRQISAIFDSAKLGYHSALVAFKVLPESLDAMASEVSKHTGVSHCYSRGADYNLWFTLTLAPDYDLQSEVDRLAATDGVRSYMLLPALKVFKIGVFLNMSGEWSVESGEPRERIMGSKAASSPGGESWSEGTLPLNIENAVAKTAVRALQTDLPLTQKPFADIADQFGMSEDQLLNMARKFLRDGIMRRYAAVLRHGKAGYTFNAMVCWKVSPDMTEEIGIRLSRNPSVSHCYERPTYPDWPYSVYTMIHAKSQDELDNIVADLAQSLPDTDYVVLKTLTEYKKSRVIYFAKSCK